MLGLQLQLHCRSGPCMKNRRVFYSCIYVLLPPRSCLFITSISCCAYVHLHMYIYLNIVWFALFLSFVYCFVSGCHFPQYICFNAKLSISALLWLQAVHHMCAGAQLREPRNCLLAAPCGLAIRPGSLMFSLFYYKKYIIVFIYMT